LVDSFVEYIRTSGVDCGSNGFEIARVEWMKFGQLDIGKLYKSIIMIFEKTMNPNYICKIAKCAQVLLVNNLK
jgi:hypothetical protein